MSTQGPQKVQEIFETTMKQFVLVPDDDDDDKVKFNPSIEEFLIDFIKKNVKDINFDVIIKNKSALKLLLLASDESWQIRNHLLFWLFENKPIASFDWNLRGNDTDSTPLRVLLNFFNKMLDYDCVNLEQYLALERYNQSITFDGIAWLDLSYNKNMSLMLELFWYRKILNKLIAEGDLAKLNWTVPYQKRTNLSLAFDIAQFKPLEVDDPFKVGDKSSVERAIPQLLYKIAETVDLVELPEDVDILGSHPCLSKFNFLRELREATKIRDKLSDAKKTELCDLADKAILALHFDVNYKIGKFLHNMFDPQGIRYLSEVKEDDLNYADAMLELANFYYADNQYIEAFKFALKSKDDSLTETIALSYIKSCCPKDTWDNKDSFAATIVGTSEFALIKKLNLAHYKTVETCVKTLIIFATDIALKKKIESDSKQLDDKVDLCVSIQELLLIDYGRKSPPAQNAETSGFGIKDEYTNRP